MASAIQRLAEYDSDERDSDEDGTPCPPKRTKLPLPSVIKIEKVAEVIDDPSLHQGRKRSYPHERGNWSSHVYLPYSQTDSYEVFCDQIIEALPELELFKIESAHISLSKTFILYYHWIQDFYNTLKQQFSVLPRYKLDFDGIEVYCNENLSRTFIALTIESNTKPLLTSIEIINKSLNEYKLPPYYEKPSFHMSFAWCHGNKKDFINGKLEELNKIFEMFKKSSHFSFLACMYILKSGFKTFVINLQ